MHWRPAKLRDVLATTGRVRPLAHMEHGHKVSVVGPSIMVEALASSAPPYTPLGCVATLESRHNINIAHAPPSSANTSSTVKIAPAASAVLYIALFVVSCYFFARGLASPRGAEADPLPAMVWKRLSDPQPKNAAPHLTQRAVESTTEAGGAAAGELCGLLRAHGCQGILHHGPAQSNP